MRRHVQRIIFFLLGLALLAAPFAGGYWFFSQRQAARSEAPPITVGDGGEGSKGLDHLALGLYIKWREADIKRPAGTDPRLVSFSVRPGDTAEVIGRNLAAQGLINDAELFRQVVKYWGVGSRLEAGEYQLRATMTMEEIIEILQHSRATTRRLTVQEGLRLEEVAEVVATAGLGTASDFIAAAQMWTGAYPILRDRPAGQGLEGYLYPDTYDVDLRWGPDQVVDLMVRTLDQHFTPQMRQQAAARGLTIHQVLTLASLVERETVVARERTIIAGVYLNRWRAGMRLEADPTVQYALGYQKNQKTWWKSPLLLADLDIASPYNTYRVNGLPPGPICNPGLASIKAVLEPAATDYLFFVATGDGSHAFAKTLEEHLENIRKYQK